MNYGKAVIGIRLMLLRDYLQANAGRNKIVSRRELEDYLKEKGYPIEKKTLYSDFAILGTEFGMQLEYDPHKKGYRLTVSFSLMLGMLTDVSPSRFAQFRNVLMTRR